MGALWQPYLLIDNSIALAWLGRIFIFHRALSHLLLAGNSAVTRFLLINMLQRGVAS